MILRHVSAILLLLLGLAQAAPCQLTWTQLAPTTSPTARSGHKLAYHAGRQRVVLFGGRGATGAWLDDTWEFDGVRWQQIVGPGPLGRGWHSMVYDPARDAIVLFGGLGSAGAFGDVWLFTAQGTWRQLLVAGRVPAPRFGHVAALLPGGGSMVVFCGTDGTLTFGDHFQLDQLGTWRVAISAPSARAFAGLAFDSQRGAAVLTGGTLNGALLADTWELTGGRWQQISPNNNLAVTGIDLAYDPIRQRTVYFGGQTVAASLSATHGEFALGGWSLFGIARPPARAEAALVYAPNLGKLLLFGGVGASGALADTWTLGSRIDAAVTPFGAPCGAGPLVLDAATPGARPWIGDPFTLALSNLPSRGATLLHLGGSATQWLGLPLPLALGNLGLPACFVHAALEISVSVQISGASATAALAIPPSLALNGAQLFAQGLSVDGQGLPAGLRLSNAVRLTLGLR